MSACLFVLGADFFEKAPIEDIEKRIENWKKIIKDFETDAEKQDSKFEQDRYDGCMTNLGRGVNFMAGYRRAKSE